MFWTSLCMGLWLFRIKLIPKIAQKYQERVERKERDRQTEREPRKTCKMPLIVCQPNNHCMATNTRHVQLFSIDRCKDFTKIFKIDENIPTLFLWVFLCGVLVTPLFLSFSATKGCLCHSYQSNIHGDHGNCGGRIVLIGAGSLYIAWVIIVN